jgi:hypothetical protein
MHIDSSVLNDKGSNLATGGNLSSSGIELITTDHASDGTHFMLKVIYKEVHHEIFGLNESSTIAELKAKVLEKSDIAITRQRLILNGRPLKPDSATLSTLKIANKSVIHLFPLPESSTAPPQSTSESINIDTSNEISPFTLARYHPNANANANANTDHFLVPAMAEDDPVEISRREVRMWTLLLTMMSITTIFSNVNIILVKGLFLNLYL